MMGEGQEDLLNEQGLSGAVWGVGGVCAEEALCWMSSSQTSLD